MKKLKLMKTFLVAAALLMGGSSAWADETKTSVYSNDFGDSSDWTAKGKTDGWTCNPGTTTANTFNSNVIGVGAGTGDMGLVSPSMSFAKGVTLVDVELKFKLDACTGGKSSGIEFITSDVNINNGYVSSGIPFFSISASASGNGYWGTIKVNETDYTSTLNQTSGTYENNNLNRNTTGIITLNVRFNFTAKTATFSMSRGGSVIIASTSATFANTDATTLDRIFIHAGKSYGGVTIDDVKVYSVESDDVETTYLATFTETNSLNPTVTIYSDSEMTEEITNGLLEDKMTYYYKATLVGYNDYTGSFTVSSANPSVSFTMEAKSQYSYTVNAKAGEATLKELHTGKVYEGATAEAFYYPQYLKSGSVLYYTPKAQGGSDYYKYTTYVPSKDNDVLDIDYTKSVTNVVYFAEGEDIEGSTSSSSSNADIRCSMGAGGYFSADADIVTLPAGKYHIYTQVWGGAGISFVFMAGDNEILTNTTTGSLNPADAEFTLTGETTIKLSAAGSGGKVLDWVYIVDTNAQEIDDAIADCKTYETSSEFATAVAGETFTTAAEVYAFHTQWQISNASDNDITKVIRNAAVADVNDWDGASQNFGEQYTGAPDNKYIDKWNGQMWATQTVYGLPAGKYQVKVATRAAADTYTHVYVSNGSYDICTAQGENVGNGSAEGTADDGELGSGWSWTYVPFEITGTTNITLGFYADARNEKWAGCDDWHLYKVTENQSVDISYVGWATLYTPYALDFSNVSGLEAYTATVSGDVVTLAKVDNIQPRSGVVLKGAEGSYSIPLADTSSTPVGDLKGSVTWATNYSTKYDYYYLALNDANEVQFTLLAEGGSIAAGKAYLQTSASSSARALKVVFDESTGIEAIENVKSADNNAYNLAGQRVAKPTKGLYIMNGKKVIVK